MYFVELVEEIESSLMKSLGEFKVGEDNEICGITDLLFATNHNLQALRILSRQRKQLSGSTLLRFTNSDGPVKLLKPGGLAF